MPSRRATYPSAATRADSAAVPPRYSLDFPSNTGNGRPPSTFTALQYLNPHTNGLPIWGPSGIGITYFRRYRPRNHTGYYAPLWWSNNGTFLWNSGSADSYYGNPPYPRDPDGGGALENVDGTVHDWEISTGGGDVILTRAGIVKPVEYDRWYLQALRVVRNGDNTKTLTFFIDLPSVDDASVIETTVGTGFGETNPPSPALTVGDSPWRNDYQNERASGRIGENLIIAKAMSDSDIIEQALALNGPATYLATADSVANIWYGKKGYLTVDDLTCDFGTGRAWAWANSNKATLAALTG